MFAASRLHLFLYLREKVFLLPVVYVIPMKKEKMKQKDKVAVSAAVCSLSVVPFLSANLKLR